ncbi:MAG TPA: sugar ABC transporter ATP-binding protein [Trebonia sp.]|nr:sugar ABC transporter ATP-binding protein [Trebonia sp.]
MPRLMATNISKRYGPELALKNVDLTVGRGEIVAVIGENGAGKSTLSKVLSGAIRSDTGELRLDDELLHVTSPRDALRAGIAYIPQELAYLPNLTVAENLLVGRWPSRLGFTNKMAVRREATRLADRFGIQLDVHKPIVEMALAERQLVEILKALARNIKVLTLDEPTASLTSEEARNLFRVLRNLAASGVAIIFISHRLDEIFEIADRIVVLRNGAVVAAAATAEMTPLKLIDYMLGTEAASVDRTLGARGGGEEPVLSVRGWSRPGWPRITDLSLELRKGEVLGLFGPRGSGADLVADGLGGRVSGFRGLTIVHGRPQGTFASPRRAREAGIAYVPPERKRDGLLLDRSIQENLSLLEMPEFSRVGFVNGVAERRMAERWRDILQIRCRSVTQRVSSLSGGNQQKVLLGSRLVAKPGLLVLNEPTRGVDVGTRAQIHRYLKDEARRGTAVLWVTSDVEEVVLVSDRILVMRDGRLVGELTGSSISQARALALAAGEEAAA